MDEQVHEVEVERERPVDHDPFAIVALGVQLLEALNVEGRQDDEQDDRRAADQVVKRRRAQEQVHDHGDDETDEAHQQQAAEALQIDLGDVADQGASAEGGRGQEEDRGGARLGVGEQDRGQRHAVEDGEDEEDELAHPALGPADTLAGQPPDDAELEGGGEPPPAGRTDLGRFLAILHHRVEVEEGGEQRRVVGDQKRRDARDREAEGHHPEHAQEKAAQSEVVRQLGGRNRMGRHERSP